MLKKLLVGVYRAYAALAFVVVVLLLFCPVLILTPGLSRRRAIGRAAVRAWLISIGVRLSVKGLEHLPQGPCIALCNHASYVDGIVFTAALPSRYTFLVQHGAETWPYVGKIISRMGVRFVNREAPRAAAVAVRQLLRAAACGESLAIFPEGGFRVEPGLLPFYDGAFYIAGRAGIPVVPAIMRGTRFFFGEGQWLPRFSAIDVEILAPIQAIGSRRVEVSALRVQAFDEMVEICGEGMGIAGVKGVRRTPGKPRPGIQDSVWIESPRQEAEPCMPLPA